jgi:peptidoglycan/LPS O-acetylase OafA/YrhL
LVLLGDASYSIYLFHILAGKILNLQWPLEALAMVLTGLIMHLILERRIMRMRREWRQSSQPNAGASQLGSGQQSSGTAGA